LPHRLFLATNITSPKGAPSIEKRDRSHGNFERTQK